MKPQLKRVAVFGTALSVLLLSGLGLSKFAQAHGSATGIVKERMDMMQGIGDKMKEVGAMIKGQTSFDSYEISRHAKRISEHSPSITKLFPEGSLDKPSEALPSIWKEWDEFSALTTKLTTEAEKLDQIAQTGERRAITMQFAKVGKVCTGCHTDYRKKKD